MLLGLILAAALAVEPVEKSPVPDGNVTAEVQSVVSALQRAGYKALVKKDEDGAPFVQSGQGGYEFLVFFYGCEDGVNCDTVQFYAGFDEHKADLAKINSWNADNRFGRAYLSEKGSARIEMDVDLEDGGMSPALFEDNVEYWVAAMSKFATFVY
ncbi:MAG TPA: YbjN domain-containing protein [Sphingomicrobium sp.]|nr:YbjN domain-containing protein [Sphingomicrobium sp.]